VRRRGEVRNNPVSTKVKEGRGADTPGARAGISLQPVESTPDTSRYPCCSSPWKTPCRHR